MTNALDNVRRYAIGEHKIGELPKEERSDVLYTLAEVIRLSNIARQQGLLALEEEGSRLSKAFVYPSIMKNGIGLICDGTQPELVEEILTSQYWADEKDYAQAYMGYALIRAVLLIQDGVNPRVLEEIMLATISYEFRDECREKIQEMLDKAHNNKLEKGVEEYNRIQLQIQNEEICKLADKLEMKLSCMPCNDVQRLLRDVDITDLTSAMLGLSEKGKGILFQNMSSKLSQLVKYDISQMVEQVNGKYYCDEESVKQSLERILRIRDKLSSMGELMDEDILAALLQDVK